MVSISRVRNHEGGFVTTDGKVPLFIVRPGSLLLWVLQNPLPNKHRDNKLGEEYFYTPLDPSVLRAVLHVMCVHPKDQ